MAYLPMRGPRGPCLLHRRGSTAGGWSYRHTQSTIPHRLPPCQPALRHGCHCGLVRSKDKILLVPTLFFLCSDKQP